MRTLGRTTRHRGRTPRRGQAGLGSIAVLVVLVVLAALAAAIVRIGGTAHATLAQDTWSARAWQAARAGTEWGVYQALKGGWSTCSNQSQTLDLRADTGMRVSVSCNSQVYNEGESSPGVAQSVRVFTLDAVACNSSVCPDDAMAVQPGYVERRRQVQVTQ
jgi:MSHA biogenesis protein MshP